MLNIKEQLEQAAYNEGIDIDNYEISFAKSFIVDRPSGYYIAMDYSQIESVQEEATLLAHELGHYYTGYLYRKDTPLQTKGRCEYRANAWMVKILCPIDKLRIVLASGASQIWEIANNLMLPDDLVKQAIYVYKCKGLI